MITSAVQSKTVRCAIYTRKSHEEGLDQEFNSLHAQRESAEAFIASQRQEGWIALPTDYSDGGFSGGTIERPGLQQLLKDIQRSQIDCVMVYKVDRLSRSLLDFARLMAIFDECDVSFVSVTQQFNTTTSMGRLTLNVLLSFAQFEREIIGERIRDKKAATARQGKYIGSNPFLGYDIDHDSKRLIVNPEEADLVRQVFRRFIVLRSTLKVARELNERGIRTKQWTTKAGIPKGGGEWCKTSVHRTVTNRKYIGEIVHKDNVYPGEHEAIIDRKTWDKAHSILHRNAHARAGETRRRTPALLRGILRCGHCDRPMGIAFTTRRGKRYRYYLCSHAENNGRDACPIKTVAAGEVERAVIEQLRHVFRSPDIIARTYRAAQQQTVDGQTEPLTEAHVRSALQQLDPIWDELFPAEQERVMKLLVKEVIVNADGLDIRLRTNGLRSLTAELQEIAI